MAASATRSNLFSTVASRSYRLEMDGRTLWLMMGLLGLTAVVLFYMGVVTGMGLRDPNVIPVAAQQEPALSPSTDSADKNSDLSFFKSLTGKEGGIEELKIQEQGITRQTNELISQAKRELLLEEVQPAQPARAPIAPTTAKTATLKSPRVPKTPPPAQTRQPLTAKTAQPAVTTSPARLFTVQVFSSKNQNRARQMVDDLKRQGYPAYLNLYQSAKNETWYRVRVGKSERKSAEVLSGRLEKETKLKNLRIMSL